MNFKPIFGFIAGAFLALNLNASTIKKGELIVATEALTHLTHFMTKRAS